MDNDDAIAIVGIGGKFPGADNIEEFWKILVNGENHITEIPPERWNAEAFYDSDPDAVGKTYVRKAGLLKRHDEFDNKLFGISDIEAARMDPQQRYVLECVHMALEDGGITSSVITGSNTGVFIGVMNDDYKGMSGDDLATMTNYSLTGTSQSIISARVSYVYNLLGPSMVIDTACSSSLVAIDAGVQNLKSGRCSMVICGGVNSIVSPDLFVPLSRARMISPTGQCQAFSANADGYCRGEGCGIVILKRLGEAKLDMNKIWSTIVTDCNQDGHTATPITAPSSSQQEELLKRIYSENRVDPGDIHVIEAHGTGTPVGDPIEINTLGRFFVGRKSKINKDKNMVHVASVKTNIGHLESAAGVASLIKVLLMMKNKTIVPSLHFTEPNPKIDFQRFRFKIPVNSFPWDSAAGRTQLACINCFGFGGTNAHAIVKDYQKPSRTIKCNCSKHIVLLSHSEVSGLRNVLNTFLTDISKNQYNLCDVSYTSLCRRNHYSLRVAILAENMDELKSKVEQNIHESADYTTKTKQPRIIAVFCGVGTVWKGMCKTLLTINDLFRDTVMKVDGILRQFTPMSIYDILIKGEEISDPFTGHIAIFTCQIGLWKLWESFGLQVDAVLGQSVGEVAVSYASGCLTLEQAVKVIYLRSKLLADVTGGKMFVIGNCKTQYVESVCSRYKGKACIAVHASSKSCVIACNADIVDELKQSIRNHLSTEARGDLFIKDLNVKCAYHSHHTDDAGTALEHALGELHVSANKIEVISSVTGIQADFKIFNKNYWNRNVSNPVLFKSAIVTAGHIDKFNIFLEIGPKPVLRPHLFDSFSTENAICLSSMEEHDQSAILKSAGTLFELKVNVDWPYISCKGEVCDVPKIPLNPTFKGIFLSDISLLKTQGLGPYQGSHLFVSRTHDKSAMFKLTISEGNVPFVYQHFVSGSIVVPGAFYADVALEVGQSLTGRRVQDICVQVEFIRPIQLSAKKSYFADVILHGCSNDYISGSVKRGNDVIATFEVRCLSDNCHLETMSIENLRRECRETQNSETTYEKLKELGFTYGPPLMILGDAIKNKDQCLVKMHLSDMIWNDVKRTHIHPAVLDGLLQTPGILALDSSENGELLPGGIDKFVIRRGVERNMLAYAEISRRTKEYTSYNMALLSLTGVVIAEVKNFKIKYVMETSENQSVKYELKWKDVDYKTRPISNKNKVLLFSFETETVRCIEKSLSKENEILFIHIKARNLWDCKILIKEVIEKTESFQLLYIPCLTMTNGIEGSDLFRKLNLSCMFMLAVVQVLAEKGLYVPITVVTECTQAYDLNKCDHINLCGSELWGQVRSIVREDSVIDILLLDCHPSIKAAKDFIKTIMEDRPIAVGEIVYENDHVHSNTLNRISWGLNDRLYKLGTLDHHCQVQMKATKHNDIADAFYVLESPHQCVNDQHETLSLHDVFLHSSDLHAMTMKPVNHGGFRLLENSEVGLDVITFEATAMSVKGQGITNSSICADKVILYPMKVQSTVVVPRQCVYSLADLKGYSPGVLLKAVLMYTLSGQVIHDNALVVYDEDHELCAKLLLFFLKNVFGRNASMGPKLKPTTDIIILKVLDNQDMQELMSIDSIQSITTLSSILSQSQKLMIEMKGIYVNSLQTDDVLNQQVLLSFSPVIHKYLIGYLQETGEKHLRQNDTKKLGETISLKPGQINAKKGINIPKQMLLRRDCCYIVIGGLTGLGWEIVKLLAARGAGEVISISRRKPNAKRELDMEQITRKHGCRVHSLSADISDWSSVCDVFAMIDKISTFHLKGIFQGAGILRNALSLQMTEDELTEVMKPKVLGTWNLHLISTRYPLDYFVMHSSVTSVFGNIGQSNYGAANSFLDSLAHYRRLHILNSQSINWGPLALGMMKEGSNTANLDTILKEQGYISMDVEQICQCLLDAMLNNEVQVMYGIYDWKVLGKALSTVTNSIIKHKLRGFLIEKDELALASNLSSQDELLAILNTSIDQQNERILETVFNIAGEAFTHDIQNLSTKTLIGELGIDSMQVMTFANKIHEIFGIRIPLITFISEETTFETIANLLYAGIQENGQNLLNEETKQGKTVLSPIEKRLYNAYIHNPKDPTLTIFADLELTQNVADPNMWEKILARMQTKYTTLRTLIQANENKTEIVKVIINPDDAKLDFQVVDIQDLEHNERLPWDMRPLLFDPSKDFPIRALFANNSNKCILRIVFSHLLIDFTSIGTLVSDLTKMFFNKTQESGDFFETDVFPVFHKQLAKKKSQLRVYWKNRTPRQIKSMSISGLQKEDLDPYRVETVNHIIPITMVDQLRKAMQHHKVKLSEVVISLYHVLLYQQLRSDIVAIFMNMDMRIHFPEYKGYVGRFANLIPLYAEVDKTMSLLSIINMNKQSLTDALENGLLPFGDIVEFIEDDTLSSVYRHQLSMDYQQDMDESLDRLKNMKLKRMVTGNYYMETQLLVWYNLEKNYLEFEIAYSSLVFDKQKANIMLDIVVEMIKTFIENPETTVDVLVGTHSIRDELKSIPNIQKNLNVRDVQQCINHHTELTNNNEHEQQNRYNNGNPAGSFFKRTKGGWSHPVWVTIEGFGTNCRLSWGRNKDKLSKTVYFKEMKHISLAETNGTHIMYITGRRRQYTFSTKDSQVVDHFKAFISELSDIC